MNIEEINEICIKYNIENYTINDDMSIDVNGDVSLYYRILTELPLNFRKVTGSFTCSNNNLKTLKGVPSSVGGKFDCSWNYLKSLEGAPSSVDGYFYCYNNPLESLKGIPLNLSGKDLFLPFEYSYSDYLEYSNRVKRDLKFKKILK